MNRIEQTFHLDRHLLIQQQRSKRARLIALSAVTLSVAGAVGTFVTSSFDEPVQAFPPSRDARAGVAAEDKVALNLMSFQPKSDAEVEVLNQKLAAQQANVKKLSEQLSALVSRVNALESAAAIRNLQPFPTLSTSTKPSEHVLPTVRPAMAAKPLKKQGPSSKSDKPDLDSRPVLATASKIGQQ